MARKTKARLEKVIPFFPEAKPMQKKKKDTFKFVVYHILHVQYLHIWQHAQHLKRFREQYVPCIRSTGLF